MADDKEIILKIKTDTSGAGQDLDNLKNKIVDISNTDASKSVQTLKLALKEANYAAQRIANSIGTSSPEFIKAANNVAKIKKEFQDYNQTIKAFNPANKLQAMVSVGQAAIGIVQGITGAMSLLGVESASSVEIIKKLQALMALSMALDSVDHLQDAFKDLKRVIGDVILKMKAMSAASMLTLIGVIAVAVALLVENWDALTASIKGADKVTKAMESSVKDITKSVADATKQVDEVNGAFKLFHQGLVSKKDVLKKYNDELGDTFGKTNNVGIAEKRLADNAAAYIKMMMLKAEANAFFAKSAEESAAALVSSYTDERTTMERFWKKVAASINHPFDKESKEEQEQQLKFDQEQRKKEHELIAKKAKDKAEFKSEMGALVGEASGLKYNLNKPDDKKDAKKDDSKQKADLAAIKKNNEDALKILAEENKSARDKEITDLQIDYDKKKKLADKYHKSTLILTEAFEAGKKEINKKYDEELKAGVAATTKYFGDLNRNAEEIELNDLKVAYQLKVDAAKKNGEDLLFINAQYLLQKAEIQKKAAAADLANDDSAELTNAKTDNAPSDKDNPTQAIAKLQNVYDITRKIKLQQLNQNVIDAKGNLSTIRKLNADFHADDLAQTTAIEQAKKEARQQAIAGMVNSLNQMSDIVGKNTVAGKALAIASTTISTFQAAQTAYAAQQIPLFPGDMSMFIRGNIARGIAVAAGLAEVKKIVAVKVPHANDTTGGGAAPILSAPQINSTMLNPSATAIKDVRVTNQQDQVVKAYISQRDLDINADKQAFLQKLGNV